MFADAAAKEKAETMAGLAAFAETAAIAGEQRVRRGPRGPGTAVLRAVMRLAGEHGELVRHAETPWASVTFAGSRHAIALGFSGTLGVAAGERFIEALADHEFHIAGQLVADAAVTAVVHDMLPEPQMAVEVEMLLLEEG